LLLMLLAQSAGLQVIFQSRWTLSLDPFSVEVLPRESGYCLMDYCLIEVLKGKLVQVLAAAAAGAAARCVTPRGGKINPISAARLSLRCKNQFGGQQFHTVV
jgi:hypothetical protein